MKFSITDKDAKKVDIPELQRWNYNKLIFGKLNPFWGCSEATCCLLFTPGPSAFDSKSVHRARSDFGVGHVVVVNPCYP